MKFYSSVKYRCFPLKSKQDNRLPGLWGNPLYMIGVTGIERKASCSPLFHYFGMIDLNEFLLCSPLAMVFNS